MRLDLLSAIMQKKAPKKHCAMLLNDGMAPVVLNLTDPNSNFPLPIQMIPSYSITILEGKKSTASFLNVKRHPKKNPLTMRNLNHQGRNPRCNSVNC